MRQIRDKRAIRVRRRLKAVAKGRPRLSVFISNKHIYAQIIDDEKGHTLVAASDKETGEKGKTVKIAQKVGSILAKKALKKKISTVWFDKGGRSYHGRIAALADAARKGGLKF